MSHQFRSWELLASNPVSAAPSVCCGNSMKSYPPLPREREISPKFSCIIFLLRPSRVMESRPRLRVKDVRAKNFISCTPSDGEKVFDPVRPPGCPLNVRGTSRPKTLISQGRGQGSSWEWGGESPPTGDSCGFSGAWNS